MGINSTLKKIRNQKAVWWAGSGETNQYGENIFSEPVEILCRWDDMVGEFKKASGETIQTKAVVIVDRDMNVGDRLKLGELDSDTPESPIEDVDAWIIQAWAKNPDAKAKQFVRRAYL